MAALAATALATAAATAAARPRKVQNLAPERLRPPTDLIGVWRRPDLKHADRPSGSRMLTIKPSEPGGTVIFDDIQLPQVWKCRAGPAVFVYGPPDFTGQDAEGDDMNRRLTEIHVCKNKYGVEFAALPPTFSWKVYHVQQPPVLVQRDGRAVWVLRLDDGEELQDDAREREAREAALKVDPLAKWGEGQ